MNERAEIFSLRQIFQKSFSLFVRVSFVSVMCTTSAALAEDGGVLGGVAKIIEAASPIGEAAARATADKQIAQINADASVAITQIGANTSLYLADVQASVALYQSMTAQLINKYNQDGVTDRLVLQLNELRAARQDAYQAEREKLALQRQFQNQQIALAYKQAADSLALAREQMKLQLTQAGLSQGFSNSRNSGAGLTVTRLGLGNTTPSTTISANPAFATTAASRGAADESVAATDDKNTQANLLASIKPKPVQKQAAVLAGKGRSATTSRLLAGVGTPSPRITYTNTSKPPVVLASSGQFATASAARGSTSGVRLRLDVGSPGQGELVASRETPSDLRGFMQAFRPVPSDNEPVRHGRGARGPASSPATHGAEAVGSGGGSVGSGHRGQ